MAEVEGQRGRGRAARDADAVVVAALAGRAVGVGVAVFPANGPRGRDGDAGGTGRAGRSVRARRADHAAVGCRPAGDDGRRALTTEVAFLPGTTVLRHGIAGRPTRICRRIRSRRSVSARAACPATSCHQQRHSREGLRRYALVLSSRQLYRGRSQELEAGRLCVAIVERAAARMGRIPAAPRLLPSRCDVEDPQACVRADGDALVARCVLVRRLRQGDAEEPGRRRRVADGGRHRDVGRPWRGRARVRRRGRPSRGRLDEPAADESVHAGPGPERAPDDRRRQRPRSGRRGHDRRRADVPVDGRFRGGQR